MAQRSKIGINSFWLKVIAMSAMLVDHVGVVFFPESVSFRIIGRIAFPIYSFLIVEGFFHTSNVKKYMARLLLFALISEIPFNMMVTGHIVDFDYQNVFFTLFIGLAMINAMYTTAIKIMNPMLSTVWLIMAMVAAELLKTDYSIYGIAVIYLFYYFRGKPVMGCIGMAVASLMLNVIQCAAAIATIPILLYNGEKGPKWANNKLCKYAFYLFYPMHMLILVGILIWIRC